MIYSSNKNGEKLKKYKKCFSVHFSFVLKDLHMLVQLNNALAHFLCFIMNKERSACLMKYGVTCRNLSEKCKQWVNTCSIK